MIHGSAARNKKSDVYHGSKGRRAGTGQVLLAALAEAGLGAEDLAVLEMHGTGTPLGDPIEVGAALAVLSKRQEAGLPVLRRLPLTLAAVKTRLGHTEPAAGAAGLCHALSWSVPLLSRLSLSGPHRANWSLFLSRMTAPLRAQWS